MALINKTTDFVRNILKDRDESHGFNHAIDVFNYATQIAHSLELSDDLIENVQIVALLHDVADHKYDHNSTLYKQVLDYLSSINRDDYIKIIERISYSVEKKNGCEDWLEILGEEYFLIRNIVSDADKLCALGENGYERCVEYVKFKNSQLSNLDVYNAVDKHMNEKLLQLKDNYIRTDPGKNIACILHNELITAHNEYKKTIHHT